MPSQAELMRRFESLGPATMPADAEALVARYVAGRPDAELLTEMLLGERVRLSPTTGENR